MTPGFVIPVYHHVYLCLLSLDMTTRPQVESPQPSFLLYPTAFLSECVLISKPKMSACLTVVCFAKWVSFLLLPLHTSTHICRLVATVLIPSKATKIPMMESSELLCHQVHCNDLDV